MAEGEDRALVVELGFTKLINTNLGDLVALNQRLQRISGSFAGG